MLDRNPNESLVAMAILFIVIVAAVICIIYAGGSVWQMLLPSGL